MKTYLEWARLVDFEYWPGWMKALVLAAVVFVSFAGCVDSF